MSQNGVISLGSLGTQVESRKGFKPDPNFQGGICMAFIEEVKFLEIDNEAQKPDGTPNAWEYAGKKTFGLEITFKQISSNPDDQTPRYITLRETSVSAGKNTGEPMDIKTWVDLIKNQFAKLQHITNELDKANLGGKSTPIAADAINFAFTDSPEIRLAASKKMFSHFEKAINGKDKEKARWEKVPVWLRVVADYKKGTYYTIPGFVGQGFIEVIVKNKPTSLELAANDSIILTKKDSKPTAKADMNLDKPDSDITSKPVGGNTADEILAGLM